MVALVEGNTYVVTKRLHGHQFPIGEKVTLDTRWSELSGIFQGLDGNPDNRWALEVDEVEEA